VVLVRETRRKSKKRPGGQSKGNEQTPTPDYMGERLGGFRKPAEGEESRIFWGGWNHRAEKPVMSPLLLYDLGVSLVSETVVLWGSPLLHEPLSEMEFDCPKDKRKSL